MRSGTTRLRGDESLSSVVAQRLNAVADKKTWRDPEEHDGFLDQLSDPVKVIGVVFIGLFSIRLIRGLL